MDSRNSLNERLSAAIRRGISEGMKRARRSVYTIDAYYIESETSADDMSISQTFYDEDEALDTAREFARGMTGADETVIVYVYSGEYQTPSGDIFGEPEAFYSISNRDRETTAQALTAAGYVTDKCDEYATDYLEED